MPIDKKRLSAMFGRTASLWRENAKQLGIIDSRFGDGDHGITIEKIANLVTARVDQWRDESIKSFIAGLGEGILAIGCGSAGPFYGTFVEGLAEPLADSDTEIDAPLLKKMFAAALAALQELTKAKVGDKTMMDAIIPAVNAAEAAGDNLEEILAAASEAGIKGADDTKNHIANFGRARLYVEETIGTPDVGAISASLFFQGLCEGFSSDCLA